ncbi:hypothetical protein K440DRAFT_642504 [Wilcoxina mikolae CBS 423.85]|nr:hypothetical protein K440DRAFT_642504 [Wilcoxina mikolae CBS 423.85]
MIAPEHMQFQYTRLLKRGEDNVVSQTGLAVAIIGVLIAAIGVFGWKCWNGRRRVRTELLATVPPRTPEPAPFYSPTYNGGIHHHYYVAPLSHQSSITSMPQNTRGSPTLLYPLPAIAPPPPPSRSMASAVPLHQVEPNSSPSIPGDASAAEIGLHNAINITATINDPNGGISSPP